MSNILLLTGSAHSHGTSSALADAFIRGAEEAGNTVDRFDTAFLKIHPCTACEHCHTTGEGCVFRDDMLKINEKLLPADYVVFATPLYYYTVNAQLKTAVDRFYANDEALHHGKKTSLLLTMADTEAKSADAAVLWLTRAAEFLDWEQAGNVIAVGCGDLAALKKTSFEEQAYLLGKNS